MGWCDQHPEILPTPDPGSLGFSDRRVALLKSSEQPTKGQPKAGQKAREKKEGGSRKYNEVHNKKIQILRL